MAEVTHIVDASALIAYYRRESGHERFAEILRCEENVLAMHSINLLEVYYDYYRSDGASIADQVWGKTVSFLQLIDKLDEPFLRIVGRWKATEGISLADAFAAACAEHHAACLMTADHKDFDPIEKKKELSIIWIR